MKTIDEVIEDVAKEVGANAMCKDPVAFAVKVNSAYLAQQEPVAWVDTVTSPRPRCITNLDYRSVTEAESGVEYVPLFLAPPPAVPEGYVLVPKEPTEEMCAEGCLKVGALYGNRGARSMYQAMIAAAPKGDQE